MGMKNYSAPDLSETRAFDVTIRLILILLLLVSCVSILMPFLVPILWGSILAITLYPLYKRFLKVMGGRKGLVATIMTLVMLIILIVPFVWLVSSVVGSAQDFLAAVRNKTFVVPPPNPKVADWFIIGDPVYGVWKALNANLETTILKYGEQFLKIGDRFLALTKGAVSNFFIMILSIVISGIFLSVSEKSDKSARNFAIRLAGKNGDSFVEMVIVTIRNVAKGILGVAFIQFVLMGTTMIIADIPWAGLWALLVLLFAIVQLPVGLLAIPIVIYLYSSREPLPATVWSILIILFAMSDNVLKPWLMGKGAPVPMLVIFLGAIGGMVLSGFLGLFTGAIILSLGYKLAQIWLQGEIPASE
jgi:predicted PurR-regulated permease PerM